MCPHNSLAKAKRKLLAKTSQYILKLLRTQNPAFHSLSLFKSDLVSFINQHPSDVVHLHWLQHEMLSISDIARISKPLVWTLHDMWPICGAEHLSWDSRYVTSYSPALRPAHESWLDLNYWTWLRKYRHWKKPIHIICPSNWLLSCVRDSALMQTWPSFRIPNLIDTCQWYPHDVAFARLFHNLSADKTYLLFGVSGDLGEQHKGFDLLLQALRELPHLTDTRDIELLLFGSKYTPVFSDLPYPVRFLGSFRSEHDLQLLYSAVDVMLVPSRQDNFPNTCLESLACGTPVVAFNTCGLPDLIDHKNSGYLARAFDPVDFAVGISWILTHNDPSTLSRQAASSVSDRFDPNVIVPLLDAVYHKAIINHR